MICPSVNLDLFMSGPLPGPDPSIGWRSYRESQHSAYHSFDENLSTAVRHTTSQFSENPAPGR